MRTTISFSVILSILFFISCNSSKVKIDNETYTSYLKKGVEITNLAQATLLGNVGKAIQKGGPGYAVEFCNLKASSIIDSLNQVNGCVISRVTDKNRNPENKISNKQEDLIWEAFRTNSAKDTVVQAKGMNLVYYKPIKIAMTACLNCHGKVDNEIAPATLEKLQKLYPNDLATGYHLNDLRGMWKVEFEMN